VSTEEYDPRPDEQDPSLSINSEALARIEAQEKQSKSRFQRFVGSKFSVAILSLVAIVMVVAIVGFSIQGYESWKAEGHKVKACNAIYSIGNQLKEETNWGEGKDLTTSEIKNKLSYVQKEALAAESVDPLHFTVFNAAVVLFSFSLEGDSVSGLLTLNSPYNIYTYTIYPICSNFDYLGNS
jgi:hypothetical protein